MPERNVLIAFGSPSDYEKFSGKDFPRAVDTRYHLSVASAHRTPELVERHARAMRYDGIIAGAGMCNALKDSYLKHSEDAVLVALPLSDSRTGGLSSILSSSEMPPGYPVAMSHMDDLDAAVSFVNYVLDNTFGAVRLLCDTDEDSKMVYDAARKTFEGLGVEIDLPHDSSRPVLNVVAYSGPNILNWVNDDLAIASFAMPFRSDVILHNYLRSLDANPHTVHTGVADGGNLALYAAKIVARNDPALKERLRERLKDGKKKYKPFEELRLL